MSGISEKTAPVEQGPDYEINFKCKDCGTENPKSANFCKTCGGKLKEECDCPWLHQKFHCGEEKCPGFRIFLILARRVKGQADS